MNIAAAQSGGPTCAINASLAGVFSEASRNEQIDKIYGSINGIEGIINDRLVEMSSIITVSYTHLNLPIKQEAMMIRAFSKNTIIQNSRAR